jgi:hypothetical protein
MALSGSMRYLSVHKQKVFTQLWADLAALLNEGGEAGIASVRYWVSTKDCVRWPDRPTRNTIVAAHAANPLKLQEAA